MVKPPSLSNVVFWIKIIILVIIFSAFLYFENIVRLGVDLIINKLFSKIFFVKAIYFFLRYGERRFRVISFVQIVLFWVD